jgi:hypothetical protein
MRQRSASLRERHRRTTVRGALLSTLGLVSIAGGVLVAAYAHPSWVWLPLSLGTVAFGVGLAHVPRARRMRLELHRAEEVARLRNQRLRARQIGTLIAPTGQS